MSTRGALGDSPSEFAAKMQKWALKINGAGRDGVYQGSLEAKRIFLASIARKAPSLRLRNVGKKGAKLGVAFDIKGTVNPTSLIRALGPMQIIEHRLSPHLIVPRGARGLGRSRTARQQGLASHLDSGAKHANFGRRAFLVMPGSEHGFAAYAKHPGVARAIGPWGLALPAVKTATLAAMTKAQHDAAASVFAGG